MEFSRKKAAGMRLNVRISGTANFGLNQRERKKVELVAYGGNKT